VKISVPLWLWPWPQAKRTQAQIALNKTLVRELEQQARIVALKDEVIATRDETIRILGYELRSAVGAQGGALSSQKPDWVLVGIPRPGLGVRVWASRELSGTAFDMTPMDQPPPRWVIKATMAQALTVDEPDYASAMAKVAAIWKNWDRSQEKTYDPRPSMRELEDDNRDRLRLAEAARLAAIEAPGDGRTH
jgi:hypothetical protein